VKIAQGIRPCGRLNSTFWSNVSKKIQFLGSYTLFVTPMAQRVAPAGPKTSNRPLSKLNTGGLRCAQCCRWWEVAQQLSELRWFDSAVEKLPVQQQKIGPSMVTIKRPKDVISWSWFMNSKMRLSCLLIYSSFGYSMKSHHGSEWLFVLFLIVNMW